MHGKTPYGELPGGTPAAFGKFDRPLLLWTVHKGMWLSNAIGIRVWTPSSRHADLHFYLVVRKPLQGDRKLATPPKGRAL